VKVTRREPPGKRLAGANAFAASPDPAAAGSALCAHFSRGREKCGLGAKISFGGRRIGVKYKRKAGEASSLCALLKRCKPRRFAYIAVRL
jgi:hypothetical protein